MIKWMNGRIEKWKNEIMTNDKWINENELMNRWMNEWIDEWMNDWMNKCMNKWKNEIMTIQTKWMNAYE